MTAKASRRQRRSLGKRDLQRACRRDVIRVLELSGAGRSGSAIASSTGLSVELVTLILDKADEARGGEG